MEIIQYFAVYYLSNSFAFSKVFFSSDVKDAKPRSFILSKIRSTSFSFKSVVLKLTLYSLSRQFLTNFWKTWNSIFFEHFLENSSVATTSIFDTARIENVISSSVWCLLTEFNVHEQFCDPRMYYLLCIFWRILKFFQKMTKNCPPDSPRNGPKI